VDLLLSRLQKIGRSTLEFRVEAPERAQHTAFGEPVGNLTDREFRQDSSPGGGERRLQLGVRLGF